MADAPDLESGGRKAVKVRVLCLAPISEVSATDARKFRSGTEGKVLSREAKLDLLKHMRGYWSVRGERERMEARRKLFFSLQSLIGGYHVENYPDVRITKGWDLYDRAHKRYVAESMKKRPTGRVIV